MKKLIFAAIAALSLAACALPPATTSVAPTGAPAAAQQYQAAMAAHDNACQLWSSAFSAALALRQAHQASPTLVQQINTLDPVLTPACEPPFPSTAAAVTAQTTQVMTSVGLLEYLTKESKK